MTGSVDGLLAYQVERLQETVVTHGDAISDIQRDHTETVSKLQREHAETVNKLRSEMLEMERKREEEKKNALLAGVALLGSAVLSLGAFIWNLIVNGKL